MKGLKCTSTNCEYNNGCHCEAGIINIGESGVCKTKIKKKFEPIDEEYKKLEASNEFDMSDNMDVLIQCDADKCIYNNDHVCTANVVNIKDCVTRTKCVTKQVKE